MDACVYVSNNKYIIIITDVNVFFRYGHSAVVFEGSLYIYGGFDGQMLSDILKYTPGKCSHLTTKAACLGSNPGIKCIWDSRVTKCINIEEMSRMMTPELDDVISTCPERNRSSMTQRLDRLILSLIFTYYTFNIYKKF